MKRAIPVLFWGLLIGGAMLAQGVMIRRDHAAGVAGTQLTIEYIALAVTSVIFLLALKRDREFPAGRTADAKDAVMAGVVTAYMVGVKHRLTGEQWGTIIPDILTIGITVAVVTLLSGWWDRWEPQPGSGQEATTEPDKGETH